MYIYISVFLYSDLLVLAFSAKVRDNQTRAKLWLPFRVAFALLFCACMWEDLLFLQDLQFESAVSPTRKEGGKTRLEVVALNLVHV